MGKYLSLLFCCLIHFGFAQTITISGKITESGGNMALPGVIVVSGDKGTVTDSNGLYSLVLPKKAFVIEFKFIGYETQTRNFQQLSSKMVLDITMHPDNSNLDEVVVTASKFEQKIAEVTTSIETLKPKLMESSGNLNIQTAIEQVSGVNVVKSQVNIRGGSGFSYGAGSRVLMLIDDLPVLSPDAGDIKWDFLPTENVSQIEVIKGASSALFGSSALGGVINIRTAYPKDKPETKIRVFTGWFDNYNTDYYNFTSSPIFGHGFYASHSRKVGRHDLVFSSAMVIDNQYRKDETSTYGRITANYKYHFKKVQGLMAGINFNVYRQHTQSFLIWKNDSNPSISLDGTLTKQYNNRMYFDPFIIYTKPNGEKHSFRNRYYYNDNSGIESKKNDYKSDFLYDEYQYQRGFHIRNGSELKLVTGAANTFSRVRSDSVYGDKTSDNAAAYLQLDYKFKRLLFSVGTRAEYFRVDTLERKFIKVLRAGLNWQVATATYLRASIGEGYRMPAIAELYASTSSGALKIFPNPNLKPESGLGMEVGVKQGFRFGGVKGMLDIAAFQTKYTNMIEFIFGVYLPDPNYMGNPLPYIGFAALNYTNARIRGIETTLAGEARIHKFVITVAGGYTYINPLNLDSLDAVVSKNKLLKYRNNHLMRVNTDVAYKNFSVGFTLRYNSFMTNIDDALTLLIPGLKAYRETHNEGDFIADARFSYKMEKYNSNIAFIVKNITNHEYMYAPANLGAPRYFMIQYSIQL